MEEKKLGQANTAGEFGTSVVIMPPANEPEPEEKPSGETIVRSIGDSVVIDVTEKRDEQDIITPAEKFLKNIAEEETTKEELLDAINVVFELVKMNQKIQKAKYLANLNSTLSLRVLKDVFDDKFQEVIDKRLEELDK